MDNLDDLKAIWHTAKTDRLPSSGEMLQMIIKFRRQKLRSKWLAIVISLLFSVMMITVLVIGRSEFKLVTTYTGGALIALSGVLLGVNNIKSIRRFYRLDNCSNLEFVAFIEQTRQNQIYYYKKTMVVIVLLALVGWLLYMYEPLVKHPVWLAGTYGVFSIYMAIMWFVVRPRSFKKDAEKLTAMRQRLENISNQLK